METTEYLRSIILTEQCGWNKMAEGKQQRKEMDIVMLRGREAERQKLIGETTEKLLRSFFPSPLQTEQYLLVSEVRGKGVPLQERKY